MADRSAWLRFREVVGNQLERAFGKDPTGRPRGLGADTVTQVPAEILEARAHGQLPAMPPNDLYAGSELKHDLVRQELAPLNFNPYGFENPQRVVAAVIAHVAGQFQQSGLLSQALMSDPKIAGPLSIRCNALTGLPITFTPPNDTARAKAFADICRLRWRRWYPVSERSKLHRHRITMGFARGQIIFEPARRVKGFGQFRDPKINTWMPGQYVWWYWDPARNFGRWLQSDKNGTMEAVPGDGQWLFSALSAKQPWMEGLVLSLGLRFAMRLSVALNMTRFATALASGHNVYKSPTQLDGRSLAFIQAQLADPNNLNLILPSGGAGNEWDAKWVGPNSTGAKELFLGALEEFGMESAEVILGQNLTTEVKRGSFAAAKAQALVRQDVLEYDALTDEEFNYEQILRPTAALNMGDPELAPWMNIVAEPATDIFLRAKALRDLAVFLKDAPPGVDKNALMITYGIKLLPEAEDQPPGDETLSEPDNNDGEKD